MNLWVIGWSAAGAAQPGRAHDAASDLLAALRFLPGAAVSEWRAPSGTLAAAWAAHSGVAYAQAAGDRLSLWSGRPVRWVDGRTEGGLPPGPEPEGLDGRFAAVAYDDGERALTVVADGLGAYPLYRTDAHGATWISNRAEPLRALAGSRAVDLDALAGLLGGGWPLGGQPAWRAVRRLAPGVLRLTPRGEERRDLLPAERTAAMCGAGWDAAEAAGLLVESVRALADWPGRASLVPVTGGRDSRLVLAAALRAGIDFRAATGGAPDSPDVLAARALCAAAGVEHSLLPADPAGDPWSTPEEAARVLGLSTAGTASLADAAGFPLRGGESLGDLWHSGQGGEIARRYYRAASARDRDGAVEALERVFCGRRPGRAEPLSQAGRVRVSAGIAAWVDRRLAAGARVQDLPDLFYLDERMGAWAGPTHAAVEWVRDTTSPLWSARLLPHLLGGGVAEREREAFHAAVLRELAPELVDVPYAGAARRGLAHKLRRAAQEARRLVARSRGGEDPFERVLAATRAAAAAHPEHPAWHVLDRDRTRALLDRPAAALDEMSRAYAWRVATVLLDPGLAEGTEG